MAEKQVIHLPEVCRCGKMHNISSIAELELAIHHACYHNGGIIPDVSFGCLGWCAQCHMQFEVYGLPDGDLYPCQVCAYLRTTPYEDHTICPSCGVQFGLDDAGPEPPEFYHDQLRLKWIKDGCKWSSSVVQEPDDWNPWLQLASRWRSGKVKVVKRVSREKMVELFKSSGLDKRIAAGELESETVHEAEIFMDEPKNKLTN